MPLDAPQPDLERLTAHLASNYHRDSLDLATVAQEIALSPRRVTALLSERGESFKGVLNRLRLLEARRLLIETDLQVAEIAFKVGYGNVSHFNRMFRDRFGRSPGGTRENVRNPAARSENTQPEHDAKD